jgi:type II secretion system protein D
MMASPSQMRLGGRTREVNVVMKNRWTNPAMSPFPAVVGWWLAIIIAWGSLSTDVFAQEKFAKPRPTDQKEPAKDEDALDTSRRFRGAGVQSLNDLRSLVIEGPAGSVDALSKVIEELDRLSAGSEASIKVVPLQNADSESMAIALQQVYESRESARPQQRRGRGEVAFVAIAQPNAIVVVAPGAEMEEAVSFVRELDKKSATADSQFRVFRLKQATASIVRQKLTEFFAAREDDAGLRVRVEVVADDRTNSIIAFGGPNDLDQTARLVEQLDDAESNTINEIRIFPLKYAQATLLSDLINQSIVRRSLTGTGAAAAGGQGQIGQRQGGQGIGGGASPTGTQKSTKLQFKATDVNGRLIESAILEDVTVTADVRTNSLVVTAPAKTMELVEAIINQLDRGPGPGQTVKVFTLQNSNAEELINTVQRIFSTTASGTTGGVGGAAGQQRPIGQTATPAPTTTGLGTTSANTLGSTTSLPVRFTPDYRTNSIIASGSKEDLDQIERIVLELDQPESKKRETIVYKLQNLTSAEAVTSLNDYLTRERLADQITVISVTQDRAAQDQSQGVVANSTATAGGQSTADRTPLEPQTNSIIVTANPGLLQQFMRVIEEIDQRPSQVVIQVLIAQIELNNNDELGLEVGFQNDTLFDRSLVVNNQGQANSLNPGVGFNNAPLQSPAGANFAGTGLQGLSNFALGRTSPLGYGGLIFAASSENISVLLRALKRQRRLDVLSRPQVMTLDNQQASIQIGQRIRVPTGAVTAAVGGTTSTFNAENIGIILAVTPRIGPDGQILMRVAPQISSLQRDSSGAIEGLPVGTNADGTVVETPIINITQAVTTIGANDGETVVIGGLITKETSIEERSVPGLGDIPVAEWLFKTRFRGVVKRELLIVLTPHIVATEEDADRIRNEESCRIDWIMSDVEEVHGDIGVACPPKDDPDKCHPHKKKGPILNMPLSTSLPRSIHPHKRKKSDEDESCPTGDPLAPGSEWLPATGGSESESAIESGEGSRFEPTEMVPLDGSSSQEAVPEQIIVPNESRREVPRARSVSEKVTGAIESVAPKATVGSESAALPSAEEKR